MALYVGNNARDLHSGARSAQRSPLRGGELAVVAANLGPKSASLLANTSDRGVAGGPKERAASLPGIRVHLCIQIPCHQPSPGAVSRGVEPWQAS